MAEIPVPRTLSPCRALPRARALASVVGPRTGGVSTNQGCPRPAWLRQAETQTVGLRADRSREPLFGFIGYVQLAVRTGLDRR